MFMRHAKKSNEAVIPSFQIDESAGKRERTQMALILAAEKLFGDYGIDAVGLRAISEAAQQKNSNAVQYHFGGKLGLLKAIFELREGQLQPARANLLAQGEVQGRFRDIRFLLRVCFEPNFLLYRDHHEIGYLKLHAAYLSTHRPRGVQHPVDYDSANSVSYRQAIRLLGERLAYLGPKRWMSRLESVGTMFLSVFIQHSARKPDPNTSLDELFEDAIEMMAAALTAPPGYRTPIS